MSKHTPEPWNFVNEKTPYITGGEIGIIGICDLYHLDQNEEIYIKENHLENGKRIVACVNACAGMEDPEEELAQLRADNADLQSKNRELVEMLRDSSCPSYDQLKADNKVLRDALESLMKAAEDLKEMLPRGFTIYGMLDEKLAFAREALAKTKGDSE